MKLRYYTKEEVKEYMRGFKKPDLGVGRLKERAEKEGWIRAGPMPFWVLLKRGWRFAILELFIREHINPSDESWSLWVNDEEYYNLSESEIAKIWGPIPVPAEVENPLEKSYLHWQPFMNFDLRAEG